MLSSQSTTPSLAVGSTTYSGSEGDAITVVLTPTASTDYTLTLAITPAGGFDFAQDIAALELSLDGGSTTPIETFPHSVEIASSVSMITLEFTVANDLDVETNDSFTLSATPSGGTAVTTVITLTDPAAVEATFSGPSPITVGGSARIGITLSEPLTRFHLFNRGTGASGYTVEEFDSSNFEDISSATGVRAFSTASNNARYLQDLGFDFWFYGTPHREIAVSTNGFVGFTDNLANVQIFTNPTMGAYQGGATPGEGGYDLPAVAPLLSPIAHMNQNPPSSFYGARLGAGTAEDRYIVQYTNAATLISAPEVTPQVRAASTFQVALFASGTIEFRYQTIPTSVLNVSKIGISDGTEEVNTFEEFSYRENKFDKFNMNAEANVRLVYTPKGSLINAVIKDSENNTFETVDFLANVPVGERMGSFMVSHPDDNTDWDGSRVYTVDLETDARSALLFTATAAVTYTVNDNDKPEVTLERADGDSAPISIEEGIQVELVAKLTNAPSGGAPEALVVNLGASGASSDFTYPASVTIPEDETQVSFMVMANQDNDAEFEESITLKVTTLGYGGNTPTPDVPDEIDIMIPVNDTIAVEDITASDTTEGDDVTVIVRLNRRLPASTADDAVKIELVGTDRIDDITDSSWNIASTLRSNTEAILMLTLTEDNLLEGREEITLNLVVDSALDDIFPAGDRGSGVTFNILDNDDGTIGFIDPIKTTYDEDESVVLMVGLASGISTASDIVVNYGIDLISAVAGDISDGGNLMRLATIPTGANAAAITIALTDDNDAEETELFDVFLMGVSSSNLAVNARVAVTTATSPSVSITILDDEPLEYSFVGRSLEGSGMVSEDKTAYTVQLTRLGTLPGSGGGATVGYTVSGQGSRPASAADFDGGMFPPDSNFVFTGYAAKSAEITLTVADDAVIEGDEAFRITAGGETHDVTLLDNDVPVVVVERVSGSGSVAEGSMVQFRARLTNAGPSGATEDLRVNLISGAISTISAGDVDFPDSVTIPMGMSETAVFMVNIVNDDLAEFDELVRIRAESVDTTALGNTSNPGSGYDLEISSADRITARIGVSDTDEGAGHAQVTITLSQRLPENVPSGALMLNLLNSERTNDLSGLPADVTDRLKRSSATQTPEETSAVVMIPLVDDTILEGAEGVTLSVSWVVALNDIFTNAAPPEADFTINDNEDGTIGFIAPTRTTYTEGQSVVLIVGPPSGVTTASDIDITVNYQIGTSSATRMATILAGQSTVAITIALTEDNDAEETEMFRVTLTDVSSSDTALDAKIERSTTSRTRDITILDNEPLEYSFMGSGTVSEDSTGYTVQLRRLGMLPGGGDAMVAYTVSGLGSSPANEDDFDGGVSPSGNFEFTNYNASAEITLTVADDKKLEVEETFRITAGGETHDVKLVDNESGEVGIAPVSTTSPEDGDMVQFEVSLPPGVTTDSTITVSFEIITPPGVSFEIIDPRSLVTVSASGLGTGFAQGLALPVRGLAQVARSYSIMIPAGQTSVMLTIQLTHDGDTEVREQLMVRLLSVSSSSGNTSLVAVDSNMGLANIVLLNFDVPDFFGVLPATGGPVLPVWLLLVLLLTGIALPLTALKLNR